MFEYIMKRASIYRRKHSSPEEEYFGEAVKIQAGNHRARSRENTVQIWASIKGIRKGIERRARGKRGGRATEYWLLTSNAGCSIMCIHEIVTAKLSESTKRN